jgi:hypothetical protein
MQKIISLILNVDTSEFYNSNEIQLLIYDENHNKIFKKQIHINDNEDKKISQNLEVDDYIDLERSRFFNIWSLNNGKWEIVVKGDIKIVYNNDGNFSINIDDDNIINKHFKDPNSVSNDDLAYINNLFSSMKDRTIVANSSDESSDSPTLTEQVKTFTGSVVGWAKSGFDLVDNDTFSNRLSICKGCEFWDEIGFGKTGKCKKCGCSTQAKLRLPNERCPLIPAKW